MCRSGDFNLSFESLTSKATLQELRNVQRSHPEIWARINLRGNDDEDLPLDDGAESEAANTEDEANELINDEDDSSIPMGVLEGRMQGELAGGGTDSDMDGIPVEEDAIEGLVPIGDAEDPHAEDAFDWKAVDKANRKASAAIAAAAGVTDAPDSEETKTQARRGKRKRTAPKKYQNDFYLH